MNFSVEATQDKDDVEVPFGDGKSITVLTFQPSDCLLFAG